MCGAPTVLINCISSALFISISLIKEHHIFFSKIASEKIDSITHYLPVILVITEARLLTCLFVLHFSHHAFIHCVIIYTGREAGQIYTLTAQAIRSFYHCCGMRFNLKWEFILFKFIYYVCHKFILQYPRLTVKLGACGL